jgi:squalene-hopene/tetraprenyl-beta-curcumene cyclase
MNFTLQQAAALVASIGVIGVGWHMGTTAAVSSSANSISIHLDLPEKKITGTWDQKAAASYLDRRLDWWMDWPKAQRDHQTFCVSCHTAVPYALSRPSLRKALAEQAPSPNERRLLDNVTKRVRLWKEVAPFYADADRGAYKTVESRGTESVLNALILASRDAQNGQLTADTRTALDNMWAEQQTTGDKEGAWLWLRFNNEPWEADDSDFYGATLAAVAIGSAPGNYLATPGIQDNIGMLREYLSRKSASQSSLNHAALLWAAAKLPGLIDPYRQKALIVELLQKQQADGGWSSSALMRDWKRSDGTAQEEKSDGYSTGLITFALQQAELPPDNEQLKQGIAWLTANQDKIDGCWPAYSLNKNKEHHISPETALFMNDAATSYAVLALTTDSNRHPSR